MARWVFHHRDKPESFELRAATRPAHLEYLAGFEIEAGGPLLDDEGRMCGSLLILDLPDRAAADAFVADDPYTRAGLFASTSAMPLHTVTWPVADEPGGGAS